jgi:hypothetical protein
MKIALVVAAGVLDDRPARHSGTTAAGSRVRSVAATKRRVASLPTVMASVFPLHWGRCC